MELIKARRGLAASAEMRKEISEIVELKVEGKTEVLNLIQVFQKIGLETIKAAVKRPLEGFSPACYYGCLLTRPADVVRFDDPEQPSAMETLIDALGAKAVDWNYKTECCGAGHSIARTEIVVDLSKRILDDARWRKIFSDVDSAVFVRADRAHLLPGLPSDGPGSRAPASDCTDFLR